MKSFEAIKADDINKVVVIVPKHDGGRRSGTVDLMTQDHDPDILNSSVNPVLTGDR